MSGRLAILCRVFDIGGGMPRTAATLATGLAGRGWTCRVFHRAAEDPDTLYHPGPAVSQQGIPPGQRAPEHYAAAIEDFEADVALVMYYDHSIVPHVTALARRGIPIVMHAATNPDRLLDANWAQSKGLSRAAAMQEHTAMALLAGRVRVTLPSYSDLLPDFLQDMVAAFPNAFLPPPPGLERLRDHMPRPRFLHIGGLKPHKNLAIAVEAFGRLSRDFPDWDLAVFSREAPGSQVGEEIAPLIKRYQIAERVQFHVPVEEIDREYARSEVHLITSLSEGLPNCVAEAMRNALPSIGFADCPGTNELIADGRNGLLVAPENRLAGLEAAMRALATDDGRRRDMGRQARADSAIFEPETVLDRWERTLGDTIASARDPGAMLAQRLARAGPDNGRYARLLRLMGGVGVPTVAAEAPAETHLTLVVDSAGAEAEAIRRTIAGAPKGSDILLRCGSEDAEGRVEGLDARIVRGDLAAALGAARGSHAALCRAGARINAAALSRLLESTARAGSDIGCAAGQIAELEPAVGAVLPFNPRVLAGRAPDGMVFRTAFLRSNGQILGADDAGGEAGARAGLAFRSAALASGLTLVGPDWQEMPLKGPMLEITLAEALAFDDDTARFVEENWLHPTHSARDLLLMAHVFWAPLVAMVEEFGAPDPAGRIAALSRLTALSTRLRGAGPAITELATADPAKGLAYAALVGGMLPWLPPLLQSARPVPPDWPHGCPAEILTDRQIRNALAQLRPLGLAAA